MYLSCVFDTSEREVLNKNQNSITNHMNLEV